MRGLLVAVLLLAHTAAVGKVVDAKWSAMGFAGFMQTYANGQVRSKDGANGVELPAALVFSAAGELVWAGGTGAPELTSGAALTEPPQHGAVQLAVLLDELVLAAGPPLSGQLAAGRPSIVLVVFESNDPDRRCTACDTALQQIAAVLARDGRAWNIVKARIDSSAR